MHRHTLQYKIQRPHLLAMLIVIFHVETNRRPQSDVDIPQILPGWHHRPFVTFAWRKAAKHAFVLWAQTVTHSIVQSDSRSTWPLWIGPEATYGLQRCDQKPPKNKLTISPKSTHSLATGMHGCCPAAAGDLVAVDLWNAGGKDVGASSQLGCPATAVVPRVSGSGKPPLVHVRGQLVPNLQPLLP